MLNKIAGETCDDQFWEVAGLNLLVEVGTELARHPRCGGAQPTQDDGHREPHVIDSCRGIRLLMQLLGLECSDEQVTIVKVLANREALFFWTASRVGAGPIPAVMRFLAVSFRTCAPSVPRFSLLLDRRTSV